MDELNVEELKLGDVIKITGTTSGIFLITYIDDDKMQIENDAGKIVLPIVDQKIDGLQSITLRKRNPEEGYARQNGLIEGVSVTITFNVDGHMENISGEIISLEEDCIGLQIPDNEIVYIDFGYNGLPENLNITEITLQKKEKDKVDELLEDGDRIGEAIHIFGRKKMKEIAYSVNASKLKTRYSLEEQTNNLLEDLLSTVPENQRTPTVLNGIYTIIQRYVQLRKEFSVEHDNKISYIKHGAQYRPIVQSFMKFEKSLLWFLPVTEIIKKNDIVPIDEEDFKAKRRESSLAGLRQLGDDFTDDFHVNIQKLVEIVTNYRSIHVDNRYAEFMRQLQNWFSPFLQTPEQKNIIHHGFVNDNFKVIVNNGNFETIVAKCGEKCKLVTKKMFSLRYNDKTAHLNPRFVENNNDPPFVNLFNPDALYLKSLITLPEPFVRFSCVQLPGTTIMEKSNMGRFFINYNELFKMKLRTVNVTPYLKKSLINENNTIKGSLYGEGDKFLSNVKNYVLHMNEVKRDELFEDYLSEIFPQTKQLFNLMKKYIIGKLSIVEIIKTLEPFLIYSSDITFKQYQEMSEFLRDETSKYIKTYNERMGIFRRLKNHEDPFVKNELVHIIEDNQIADMYGYENYPNMSCSEFLNIVIFTDYGDVYNNKLRYDSLNLSETNLNEKIKQTTEFSENTCKAIHLTKRYATLTDLENDNGKKIFYDEEFDKTPYYLVANHEKERSIMNDEDFYFFLETVLKNKYSMPEEEIKSVISAFRMGKREIDESKNAYAMIFNKLEGKLNYYVRDGKAWKRDESITDQPVTDDIACMLQENCLVSKSECVSDNVAKEQVMKAAISKIVTEFDKNVALSEGENTEHVNKLLTTSSQRIKNIKKIYMAKLRKYNYKQYDLGDVDDENPVLSPYIEMRDSILGEADIIKKYYHILDFVKEYTFVMKPRSGFIPEEPEEIPEEPEEPKEILERELTPVKFTQPPKEQSPAARTPSSQWTTPGSFESENSSYGPPSGPRTPEGLPPPLPQRSPEYQESFNSVSSAEITKEEFARYTGEKNVNEHWLFCKSTRTKLLPKFFYILAKTFVDSPDDFLYRLDKLCHSIGKLSDDGDKYVDKYSGYTIRYIDFMKEYGNEEDIDVYEMPSENQNEEREEKHKIVFDVIIVMEETMNVNLNEDELIISIFENTLEDIGSSFKQKYESSKKVGTYKDFLNENKLYIILAAFVIALQVHIPGVKFRSVANCGKFTGNPIKEEEKLVQYVACVASKMSKAGEPWNSLKKKVEAKKIKSFIVLIKSLNSVKNMIQERIDEVIAQGETEESQPEFYAKWKHFLPAIVPLRIATVLPMEKTNISQYIKNGNKRQLDILSAMKSKIIFYSYMFQQKMQELVKNIVDKEDLIFFNRENTPFLDNACCNETTEKSTLIYFMKLDPDIGFINNQVKHLHHELNFTYRLSKSTIFSDINTKNIIVQSNNYKYSEYTIIRYLMIMNKFANITDEENEYNEKLKMHPGFTETEFRGAMRENVIEYMPILDKAPPSMIDLFGETIEDSRAMNNRFGTMKETKMNEIKKFMGRTDISILEKLMEFENINNISFVKNCVYLFSRVFPNIIINGVVQNNLIHGYWNLSRSHETKITDFCEKYYEPLEKFRKSLDPLLEEVMKKTRDIYEMSRFVPFVEDHTTLLINVYYLVDVLHVYVKTAQGTETDDFRAKGENEKMKKLTISLIKEYLNYIKNSMVKTHTGYQDIMKHSFAFKQSEKQIFRERLEILSADQRKVDNEMRKCGLGAWAKGLKKSVFQYDKDDNEMDQEPNDEAIEEPIEDLIDEDNEDDGVEGDDVEDNVDGSFSDEDN
jgi:hypothetical protein